MWCGDDATLCIYAIGRCIIDLVPFHHNGQLFMGAPSFYKHYLYRKGERLKKLFEEEKITMMQVCKKRKKNAFFKCKRNF